MSNNVIQDLLRDNKQWATQFAIDHPGFFKESAENKQTPLILWIGCVDSRVPESVITASLPGAIFVQRNVANQYQAHDDNVASVLDYGVHDIQVQYILVVGHTKCGGVTHCYDVCLGNPKGPPPADTALTRWLEPIQLLAYRLNLRGLPRDDGILELIKANVRMQYDNIKQAHVIKEAGAKVQVLPLLYHLENGMLEVLPLDLKDKERAERKERFKTGFAGVL